MGSSIMSGKRPRVMGLPLLATVSLGLQACVSGPYALDPLVLASSEAQFDGALVQGTTTLIARGGDVTQDMYPYVVSLQFFAGGHFCGGALIEQRWVITAAHCIEFLLDANGQLRQNIVLAVVNRADLNSDSGTEIPVIAAFMNPGYQVDVLGRDVNDVALLQLAEHEDNLPTVTMADRSPWPFESLLILGWGETETIARSPVLQQATMRASFWCPLLPDGAFCARDPFPPRGRSGSCDADSGGPVISRDGSELYGVISFSSINTCAPEGANAFEYEGYADLFPMREWIDQIKD